MSELRCDKTCDRCISLEREVPQPIEQWISRISEWGFGWFAFRALVDPESDTLGATVASLYLATLTLATLVRLRRRGQAKGGGL